MWHSRAVWRLLSLFVLAIGVFSLQALALGVLAIALIALAAWRNTALLPLWWSRVLRLKWFFLAIFILYLLGGMRLDGHPDWAEACYRVGVLVLLVGVVAICLDRLPARELADGISRLIRPLELLQLPVDAISRRLAATLDAVAHMDARLRSLDRRQGLSAVAEVCLEAEQYSVKDAPMGVQAGPLRADRILLGLSVMGILGLQWL